MKKEHEDFIYKGIPILDDEPEAKYFKLNTKRDSKDAFARMVYGTNHKWYYDIIYFWHKIKLKIKL